MNEGLYQIQYRSVDGKPTLFTFERNKNKIKQVTKIQDFKPYFYVDKDTYYKQHDFKKFITKVDTQEYKTIFGTSCLKCFVSRPSSLYKIQKMLKHEEVFEIDVGLPQRYAIDKIGEVVEGDYKIVTFDIETDCSSGFPKYETPVEPIICMTLHDSHSNKTETFVYREDLTVKTVEKADGSVRYFNTERDMLVSMIEYWNYLDADILTGWNINFDLRYLISRLAKLNISNKKLSTVSDTGFDDINHPITGEALNKLVTIRAKGEVEILGLVLFDMLAGYKRLHFGELESFSLNSVAETELKAQKDPVHNTGVVWRNDIESLINYNRKDVELVTKINDKCKIISIFDETKRFSGICNINDVHLASKVHETRIMRKYFGKLVFPSKRPFTPYEEREHLQGAFVMEPVIGLHENVIVFDFSGLYPNIVKTFNLSPEQIGDDGIDINGTKIRQETQGIMPSIIDDLMQLKKDLKNKIKNTGQDLRDKMFSVKVIINCFSGDTEIITRAGIKNIKDIKIGDEVFSFNPKTMRSEFKPVINTFAQHYTGHLIHIKNKLIDILVTPDHNFCVLDSNKTYRFLQAKAMYGKSYLLPTITPLNSVKKTPKSFNFYSFVNQYEHKICRNKIRALKHPSRGILPSYILKKLPYREFMNFLAWYISEGCLSNYNGTNRIIITQKKHTNIIRRILKKLKFQFNETKNGNAINFNVYNRLLYKFIETYCGKGSKNKTIPQFVYNMNIKDIIEFKKNLCLGDGHMNKNGDYDFTTTSSRLKQDFILLNTYLGKYTGVTSYLARNANQMPLFGLRTHKYNSKLISVKDYSKVSYNDDVHCITVKDNHTVYAGRNNKFCVTGQSIWGAFALPSFRLHDMRLAQNVTFLGRELITKVVQIIKEEYGYNAIAGDSVTGDSEIPILRDNKFQRVTIEELYDNAFKGDKIKTYSIDDKGKVHTDDIVRIMKHKVSKDIFEIQSHLNKKIKVTADHSVFVFDKILNKVLCKKPKDISVKNDMLICINNYKIPHNTRKFSRTFYEFLGSFIADGSLNKGSIYLSGNKFKELVKKICKEFKCNYRLNKNNQDYNIMCTSLANKLRDLGFYNGSDIKRIPQWMFNEIYANKMCFLRGMFNGDGGITANMLHYNSINIKLIKDMKDLLISIGIPSSNFTETTINKFVDKKKKKNYCNNTHTTRLIVSSRPDLRPVTRKLLSSYKAGYNKWITRNKAYGKRQNNIRFNESSLLKIKNIRKLNNTLTYVYDITTKKSHRFIANDLLVHNTDSCFIKIPEGIDCVKKGEEMLPLLNNKINEYIMSKYKVKHSSIELTFEKAFKTLIIQKKKHYAGLICYEDGKIVDKVKSVGLSNRRSDNPMYSRNMQSKLIEMILRGDMKEKVVSFVNDTIDDLYAGKVSIEKIALPVKLEVAPEEYKVQNMPRLRGVRAAKKLLNLDFRAGTKFKMLYVIHPQTDTICFEDINQLTTKFKIDYNKMLDKIVIQKVKPVFEALGWNKEVDDLKNIVKHKVSGQKTLF